MDTKALFHRPFALHLSVQAPNKAAAVGFSILGNQKSSNDDAHTPPVSSSYRFSMILLMMIVYHSDAIFKAILHEGRENKWKYVVDCRENPSKETLSK